MGAILNHAVLALIGARLALLDLVTLVQEASLNESVSLHKKINKDKSV